VGTAAAIAPEAQSSSKKAVRQPAGILRAAAAEAFLGSPALEFCRRHHRRSVMEKAKREAGRGDMSQDKTRRRPAGSRTETKITDESDLGSDIQGKNSLHGDDQANRRNQRQTTPDEGG